MRPIVLAACLVPLLVASRSALAQETTPVAPVPAPYVMRPAPIETRVHDGFYLRLALGGGAVRVSQDASAGSGYDGSMFGGGGTGEISVGGTPARGLVVAASALGWSLVNPRLTSGAISSSPGQHVDLAIVGVTVDWYPKPRDGFHLGGTVGLGVKSAYDDTGTHVHGTARAGGALAAATGYDWWVGDQWSLGFLARVAAVELANTEAVPGGSQSVTDHGVAFAMLLTGVYH